MQAAQGAIGSQAYGAQGANGPTYGPKDYRPSLCVSDYVKLATAGVKMDFKDIRDQIVCDVPDMNVLKPHALRTLKEAFWDRWRRANRGSEMSYGDAVPGFNIHAHQHGEIVYVMLCPHDEPPVIIEDTAILFPSDALMAKIGLRRKA